MGDMGDMGDMGQNPDGSHGPESNYTDPLPALIPMHRVYRITVLNHIFSIPWYDNRKSYLETSYWYGNFKSYL